MTSPYIKRQYMREVMGAPLVYENTGITGKYVEFWQGSGRAILDPDGVLTLGIGFGFDGATGVPDTARNLKAAGFHDALIGMIMAGSLSILMIWRANTVFYRQMIADKMPKPLALLLLLGTHIFTGPWTLAAIAFRRLKSLLF